MKSILLLALTLIIPLSAQGNRHAKISAEHAQTGRLTVICSPMYAGKSEELIRIIRRASYAKKRILVIKHTFDDRTSTTIITAHAVKKTQKIEELVKNEKFDILCIDEVQFYSEI